MCLRGPTPGKRCYEGRNTEQEGNDDQGANNTLHRPTTGDLSWSLFRFAARAPPSRQLHRLLRDDSAGEREAVKRRGHLRCAGTLTDGRALFSEDKVPRQPHGLGRHEKVLFLLWASGHLNCQHIRSWFGLELNGSLALLRRAPEDRRARRIACHTNQHLEPISVEGKNSRYLHRGQSLLWRISRWD